MTTESEAIAHLRAIIKDPMGHVAEACEFLARVDHIGDANKMVDGLQPIDTAPKNCPILLYGYWAGELRGSDLSREYGIGLYWGPGSGYSGFEWSGTRGDGYAEWCRPTHWMNLPPAPKV